MLKSNGFSEMKGVRLIPSKCLSYMLLYKFYLGYYFCCYLMCSSHNLYKSITIDFGFCLLFSKDKSPKKTDSTRSSQIWRPNIARNQQQERRARKSRQSPYWAISTKCYRIHLVHKNRMMLYNGYWPGLRKHIDTNTMWHILKHLFEWISVNLLHVFLSRPACGSNKKEMLL